MAPTSGFNGFSKKCVSFYKELAKHNAKPWFDAHRDDFDNHVMAPARQFVAEMGERLKLISPRIQAEPRVNRSIFRINRDARFSKDKRPYTTRLTLWFWEGNRPRTECSGFYFHLEPPQLMLGTGIYRFSKPILDEYRRSVVHAKHGPSLLNALDEVRSKKRYNLWGMHYKKIPRGFDPKHECVELLLYNGLYLGFEDRIPQEFYSAKLLDWCFQHFSNMAPLHAWLVEMMKRAGQR